MKLSGAAAFCIRTGNLSTEELGKITAITCSTHGHLFFMFLIPGVGTRWMMRQLVNGKLIKETAAQVEHVDRLIELRKAAKYFVPSDKVLRHFLRGSLKQLIERSERI